MTRSHHRRTGRSTVLALSAALTLTGLALGTSPAQAATAPAQHASKTWRDAGRLIGPGHDWPTLAASNSGTIVAVATSGGTVRKPSPTLVVRRLPNGTVSRYNKVLGLTAGVGIDQDGDILVLGQRGDDLLVTSWPRSDRRPTTHKVIDADSVPGLVYAELMTNSRGDAAIVAHYRNDATLVKRKFGDAQRWRPAVRVNTGRYDGSLDDVAMTRTGRLVGAFRDELTLTLRSLSRSSRTFTAARRVITWPIDDDFVHPYEETGSVTVGPQGDLIASLSFAVQRGDGKSSAKRSDNAYFFKYMIKPVGDHRYSGEIDNSDWITFDQSVVGADGSVTVRKGLTMMRWTPDRWRSVENAWFHAKNPRGDVLVGSAAYRGTVHLWPLGKKQQPAVAVPRGYARAWALTNTHRTYVLSQRGERRPSFFLSIGGLPR